MAKWLDYYEILGVSSDASSEEIRKRYIELSRKYHPDVCKDQNATKKMTKINVAYETLSNQKTRRKYDIEYMAHYASKKAKSKNNTSPKSWNDDRIAIIIIPHYGFVAITLDIEKIVYLIVNCQEIVDSIINVKKEIFALILEKEIDKDTGAEALNRWYLGAQKALTDLELARKLAKELNLDTTIISEQIARLRAAIDKVSSKNANPKQYSDRVQWPFKRYKK